MERTSLILDDVSLSLRTCLLKVFLVLFLASACICELTVLGKDTWPLIQFFSYKASPLNCFGNGLMYNLQCEEAGSEKGR